MYPKNDRYSIKASPISCYNSSQYLLKRNLPLKSSTLENIKLNVTIVFVYLFVDHSLHGNYETIQSLSYFQLL